MGHRGRRSGNVGAFWSVVGLVFLAANLVFAKSPPKLPLGVLTESPGIRPGARGRVLGGKPMPLGQALDPATLKKLRTLTRAGKKVRVTVVPMGKPTGERYSLIDTHVAIAGTAIAARVNFGAIRQDDRGNRAAAKEGYALGRYGNQIPGKYGKDAGVGIKITVFDPPEQQGEGPRPRPSSRKRTSRRRARQGPAQDRQVASPSGKAGTGGSGGSAGSGSGAFACAAPSSAQIKKILSYRFRDLSWELGFGEILGKVGLSEGAASSVYGACCPETFSSSDPVELLAPDEFPGAGKQGLADIQACKAGGGEFVHEELQCNLGKESGVLWFCRKKLNPTDENGAAPKCAPSQDKDAVARLVEQGSTSTLQLSYLQGQDGRIELLSKRGGRTERDADLVLMACTDPETGIEFQGLRFCGKQTPENCASDSRAPWARIKPMVVMTASQEQEPKTAAGGAQ